MLAMKRKNAFLVLLFVVTAIPTAVFVMGLSLILGFIIQNGASFEAWWDSRTYALWLHAEGGGIALPIWMIPAGICVPLLIASALLLLREWRKSRLFGIQPQGVFKEKRHIENTMLALKVQESKHTTINMIFVLGLVLLVIGFSLTVITQEVTRYRDVFGFQVPYKTTEQPYQGIGILLVVSSIALIIGSIYSRHQNKGTNRIGLETPNG